MLDLLQIGKFGVLNSQKLLSSTSNNINNVNTEGFTRRRTVTYTNSIEWGVGHTDTTRIYNQYVQRELYSDNGSMAYYTALSEGMSSTDSMLSDDEMSLSTAMSDFYDALSTSVQDPTSLSSREEVLADLKILTNRAQTLNSEIQSNITNLNAQVADSVTKINNLTYSINKLNMQIIAAKNNSSDGDNNEVYLEMCDSRDELINELSSEVGISTVSQDNGSISVYMTGSGQLLANDSTYASFSTDTDQYDATKTYVYMTFHNQAGSYQDTTSVKLNESDIGGTLGGTLESCSEIRQTMRELGRLMVAFADANNVQNEAGFTLEGTAGGEVLNIDSVYATTNDADQSVGAVCEFVSGAGENVTANDYRVTFENGYLQIYEEAMDGTETDITDTIGSSNVTTDSSGNLVIDMTDYAGIKLTFTDTEANLSSDKTSFYFQPTINQAYTMNVQVTKAEDLAYAAAVRTSTTTGNLGNATISLESMTATGTGMGVSVNSTTNMPEFNADAPVLIKITDDGDYGVYDSDGDLLATAPASCNGQNIFGNAVLTDGTAFSTDGYPGYEVSVTGTVEPGDSFAIEINTDGTGDNTNGITMAALKSEDLVGTSSTSTKQTFTESYASLTSRLGSAAYEAENNLTAATTKQSETQELYDSDAGVNLDEEAASLIQYQQTYQACAKIITASQTIFDSLISAF
jgi:flagellar hook-associated protein 1 FlgK